MQFSKKKLKTKKRRLKCNLIGITCKVTTGSPQRRPSCLISTVDRSGPAKHINFLSWGGGGGVGTETHLSGEAYGIHI